MCHPIIVFVDIVKQGRKEIFYLMTSNKAYAFKKIRSEMLLRVKSVRSGCAGSSDRSSMVDSLSYFSFQPVLLDW